MNDILTNKPHSAVQEFMHSEAAGGIILLIASVAAFICANSTLYNWYEHWLHLHVALNFGEWHLDLSLSHFINDGLMVIFFFMVGLEIKREVLSGELASPKKASLAIVAAIGGMVVPALIYYSMTKGHPELSRGWGIPMATDIAFALGVISLLGKRVPLALKVFLTALAIVDDLGAIAVIAIFYTSQLNILALIMSLVTVIGSFIFGRMGGRRGWIFALLCIVAWYFMLLSGIHATIAGVLMALTIPIRTKLGVSALNEKLQTGVKAGSFELNQSNIEAMEIIVRNAESPLHRFERRLHPWVVFIIMPVFAFSNAGVHLPEDHGAVFAEPHVLGIMLGLVFGKMIGVFGASFIAVKLGISALPDRANWSSMLGVACLAGLGFTMSLFIAVLAFPDSPELLEAAKLAIIGGSLIAVVVGSIVTYVGTGRIKES